MVSETVGREINGLSGVFKANGSECGMGMVLVTEGGEWICECREREGW